MSRIGNFSFSDSCELHVVNAFGKSAPINDNPEVDLEVECVLYCDDPEDGVYGTDVKATICGTEIELGSEAVDLLGLENRAGEVFMDGGVVYPKAGTKYRDVSNREWTVVGSGMHHEDARDYTLLKTPIIPRRFRDFRDADPFRRKVVETHLLVHPPRVLVEEPTDGLVLGDEDDADGDKGKIAMFRLVVEEDEPPPGTWRSADCVYVGKPKTEEPK